MDGVQLPQGYSHFEEAVYFLPLSSQKFLVLTLRKKIYSSKCCNIKSQLKWNPKTMIKFLLASNHYFTQWLTKKTWLHKIYHSSIKLHIKIIYFSNAELLSTFLPIRFSVKNKLLASNHYFTQWLTKKTWLHKIYHLSIKSHIKILYFSNVELLSKIYFYMNNVFVDSCHQCFTLHYSLFFIYLHNWNRWQ